MCGCVCTCVRIWATLTKILSFSRVLSRQLHLHSYMLYTYEATVLNPRPPRNEATAPASLNPRLPGLPTHLRGPRPEALEWVPLIEDRSKALRVLLSNDPPPPPFTLSVFSADSGEWLQNSTYLQKNMIRS